MIFTFHATHQHSLPHPYSPTCVQILTYVSMSKKNEGKHSIFTVVQGENRIERVTTCPTTNRYQEVTNSQHIEKLRISEKRFFSRQKWQDTDTVMTKRNDYTNAIQ